MKAMRLGIFGPLTVAAMIATAASAQTAKLGPNPMGFCVKAYGVTPYPQLNIGCYRQYDPLVCQCVAFVPDPAVGPGTPGSNDHAVNEAFLSNLKTLKNGASGKEKAQLKTDIREFKDNLKLKRAGHD